LIFAAKTARKPGLDNDKCPITSPAGLFGAPVGSGYAGRVDKL